MKLQSALLQVLALVIVLAGSAQAQISITSSDIMKPVGYVFASDYAFGPVTVDNGSPGGPEGWDFSPYDMPEHSEQVVVSVASTPFASDFPTANVCWQTADTLFDTDAYVYMNITSNLLTYLGTGVATPETSYVTKFNPAGQVPLPIDYNDSWVTTQGFADTSDFAIISVLSRSHTESDAYGSMMIPRGTFDVLRTISYDTTFTSTIIGPIEFSDTTTTISYSWMGKEPLFVAESSSDVGETDPDFTEASYIQRASESTAIEDEEVTRQLPRVFSLGQNYPNPFNPHTEITFSVRESSATPVDLSIYSLRGVKIATLVSERLEPGIHTVVWNGRNEKGERQPSGVYLYRLTSGAESITKKMVLAR